MNWRPRRLTAAVITLAVTGLALAITLPASAATAGPITGLAGK